MRPLTVKNNKKTIATYSLRVDMLVPFSCHLCSSQCPQAGTQIGYVCRLEVDLNDQPFLFE